MPEMNPAEELRAAAAKIRARAEDATEGPWRVDHPEYPEKIYGGSHEHIGVVAGSRWGGEANVFDNNDDAYHIALWHPGIAELVARILDAAAGVANDEAEWLGDRIEVVLAEELELARAINSTKVA